jgi:stage V sporulation protein G
MSELRVTGCRVFVNLADDDRLKGYAAIILNNEFAVCDLKIIRGNKGLFVAMPSRRRRDGTFHDTAHPIVQGLREHIELIVLGEYHAQLEQLKEGTLNAGNGNVSSEFLNSLEPYDYDQGQRR